MPDLLTLMYLPVYWRSARISEGVVPLLAHCHVTVTVMIRDMVTITADNSDLMTEPTNLTLLTGHWTDRNEEGDIFGFTGIGL